MSRTPSRRHVLSAAAGVTAAMVGCGLWRAADQGVFTPWSGPAYEPWHDWLPVVADGPATLLRAAVLAANAHNTQPWLFAADADGIDVYLDPSRTVGAMDPLFRELHLSLGCAVENIVLAAALAGWRAEVDVSAEPTANPPEQGTLIARVAIDTAESSPDLEDLLPLADVIGDRHTDRSAYSDQAVPEDQLSALATLCCPADSPVTLTWLTEGSAWQRFASDTVLATKAITADPEQSQASHSWFRSDWDTIQSRADGITIDASGSGALFRAVGKLLPGTDEDTANKYFLTSTEEVHTRTPVFGLLSVAQPTSLAERLAAGRAWQRAHLAATADGLAAQPLNQVIERADREEDLGSAGQFTQALDGYGAPGSVVLAFRLGYPTGTSHPSPRRQADRVILEG